MMCIQSMSFTAQFVDPGKTSAEELHLFKTISIHPPLLLLLLSILTGDHGSLCEGAPLELHDRLNHCAAHVAAGENVPGLNHGSTSGRRCTGS